MQRALVSVLTPVYNAAPYLAECIESVLKQRYEHWEYIIVNNCSTDGTAEIAARYAASEPRITVVSNTRFVSMPANHNIAFGLMSPASTYCKVVSADDWITPDALERLVEVAERHPSAGIVGSYQLSAGQVRWTGLPRTVELIDGRDVCRRSLLTGLDVFGTPTSSLYRTSVVRASMPFFPHERPHADTSACYRALQSCDFAFVHEVLSTERVHDDRVTTGVQRLSMGDVAYLETLLDYGPVYLAPAELEHRRRDLLNRYYRFLGGCVWTLRGREFWQFHATRTKELGQPIAWGRVLKAAAAEALRELRAPMVALRKLARTLLTKRSHRKGSAA